MCLQKLELLLLQAHKFAEVCIVTCWCPRQSKGCFTLWPKVERPSVSTNQISRNQEFGLSTLHTRGQSPKSVALFLPTWQHFFDQSDGLSKGVWVVQEWKPKVWSRGRRIFSLKKLDSDKIWTVRSGRLFFNKA